jgi:hypothetical protein
VDIGVEVIRDLIQSPDTSNRDEGGCMSPVGCDG